MVCSAGKWEEEGGDERARELEQTIGDKRLHTNEICRMSTAPSKHLSSVF